MLCVQSSNKMRTYQSVVHGGVLSQSFTYPWFNVILRSGRRSSGRYLGMKTFENLF